MPDPLGIAILVLGSFVLIPAIVIGGQKPLEPPRKKAKRTSPSNPAIRQMPRSTNTTARTYTKPGENKPPVHPKSRKERG